jgi:hypothetical protein
MSYMTGDRKQKKVRARSTKERKLVRDIPGRLIRRLRIQEWLTIVIWSLQPNSH